MNVYVLKVHLNNIIMSVREKTDWQGMAVGKKRDHQTAEKHVPCESSVS